MMRIEFEAAGQGFEAWLVNAAGYVVATEPKDHNLYTGARVVDPLRKINEGSLLTVVKGGSKVKIKYRVTAIKYLD